MGITTDVTFSSGNDELDQQIKLWMRWDRNEKTLDEMRQLVEKKDWQTLQKRLFKRMAFGTAGLRGPMRAGYDAMNDLVIVQTAQGLCDYIVQKFPNEADWKRGIVYGYDGRYNSKRFAELSAAVFVHHGIKVHLYSRMVATPFVPFAILQLKCLAGVMVTASHNPKEDNGYKVYWENGAQIIGPHDKGIQNCILKNLEPKESSWKTKTLYENPLLSDPYESMFEAYYHALLNVLPASYMEINGNSKLRFVYTAMHGVGYPYVEEAFRRAKLQPVVAVKEQKDPDPEFPTVKFPNPEEGKSALELSIKKAEQEGITIILANDPDADRLACAEKNPETGVWKVFNGNELGALLGWWSVQNYLELRPQTDLSKCYVCASTVSSKVLRSMAKMDGYNFIETLTGFKWMGNRATEIMAQGNEVLFAFEEAIGFMFSTNVLDKDGVSAACHLATMACYIKQKENKTLNQKLNDLYDRYGYHCTNCSYLFCYDPTTIAKIFERLRNYNGSNTYPKSILNNEFRIKHVRDLGTGVDTSEPDGRAKLPVSAGTQMITFTFENGLVVTLRTSGTEPKVKYYAELCATPEEKDWAQLRVKLNRMVAAIVEEFFQPNLNKLVAKTD